MIVWIVRIKEIIEEVVEYFFWYLIKKILKVLNMLIVMKYLIVFFLKKNFKYI